MTSTVADVIEHRLRQLGVSRVYGLPFAGLQHVPVDDADLAVLLADADGRIAHHDGSGRLGAALVPGPILHLSSEPGGTAPLQTVGSVEEVLDALVDPPGMRLPGTLALHLDLDVDAPASTDVGVVARPDRQVVLTLDPSMAAFELAVVVGPGVVRASAVDDLHSFSRAAGAGVLSTWGAKGVERWDSPFHFGTAGLQDRDVELGLGSADVVITSGVDPAELPASALARRVVQDVPPTQLAALTGKWPRGRKVPTRPPLHEAIAAVLTPRYESDEVPLTAARASLHLSGALPDRGIVVADPGPAGFWIARTFPTSFPGSVCVPATRAEGFAAAAGLVCGLEGRPCLAVSHQLGGPEGLDDTTAALLDLAESLDVPVAVQMWGPDGSLASSTAHVELLEASLATAVVRIDDVPVVLDDTADLERVAGPLRKWNAF